VKGAAEVSATGGRPTLQEAPDGSSRFRMRGLFSNSQQPPHPPDHHYQRSNPIGSIVRIQQDQGRDRDDASENINPVFSQHDREVPTKFHIGCSMKHSEIIEE
jgi:hypothetical protein